MLVPVILSLVPILTAGATPALECTISLQQHNAGVQITALLKGEPEEEGWFTMETSAQTGSSRSHSRQSGKFKISAGGEAVLGQGAVGRLEGTIVVVKVSGKSALTHESFACSANT